MAKKGALLDLDNVLFPTSEYEKKVLSASIDAMIEAGLQTTHDEGLAKLMTIRRIPTSEYRDPSNAEDHFDRLVRECGYGESYESVVQSGVAAYHEEKAKWLVPQQETIEFMDVLARNNFRIAVITQGLAKKQWEKLIKIGVRDYLVQKDGSGKVLHEFVYPATKEEIELIGRHNHVLKAMKNSNINPDESFVADDRTHWIIAAKYNGVRYGFRIKQGKYQDDGYPKGIDPSLKEDFQVHNLDNMTARLMEIGWVR